MTRLHKVTTEWPKTAHGTVTLTCWCDWTWTGSKSDREAVLVEHEGRERLARELAKFVRDRLDETEAAAKAAQADSSIDGEYLPWRLSGDSGTDLYAGHLQLASGRWGGMDEGVAHHVLGHDPVRVLRQLQATRDLLDEFEMHIGSVYIGDRPQEHEPVSDILQPFVEAAACVYLDHPDFQKHWDS